MYLVVIFVMIKLRIICGVTKFLVQSALLGWLWELPPAKGLRRYSAMALWRYGPMALRCKL